MEIMIDNYHNHPLTNAINRPINWICNICKSSYAAGSINRYRCNQCDFDLCEKCKSKVGVFFRPQLHNHNLYDCTSRKTNWYCNNCKSSYKAHEVGRYRCNQCDYDVCSRCLCNFY